MQCYWKIVPPKFILAYAVRTVILNQAWNSINNGVYMLETFSIE